MSSTNQRISEAFENAKKDFLSSLKDPSIFDSISNITSSKDVYHFTTQLQHDQSKRQNLRNLNKIKPYLDRLKQYAGVIEVFMQAKPDILALIWGPIKLLLQISDNLTQSFDAIVDTISIIGSKLPLFEAYTTLFETNNWVADVLVLFYEDILKFYEIALNFFTAKRMLLLPHIQTELLNMAGWIIVFDSVWPRHKAKIQVVVSSLEHHCLLMTEEVTLEHITDARKAQTADIDRWQKSFEFQEQQNFRNIEAYISPKLYDDELDRLQRAVCERTGRWLNKEQALKDWFDSDNDTTRLVWLQGIPGAGKTHISSILASKLKSLSKTTLYAFLSYKQGDVSAISMMHSLIFQLVIGMEHFDEPLKQDLRAKLFDCFQSNQRNLKSNTRFTREVLTNLLNCVGPAYVTIDGLDEIRESERVETLNRLLEILKASVETRVLISSRLEDDIAKVLKQVIPKVIRVDDKNRGCIHAYVSVTSEKWLSQSDFDEETCTEIRSLLTPLSARAKGMFLYARVVMDNIQTYHTPELIQSELRALPESLEEAYARVIQRLNDLQPSTRTMSRRALGWIGCSPTPIKIQELSFALSLNPDGGGQLPQFQSSLNIVRLCGPIVETFGDYVYFVHFTVKEYLFDKQADAFLRALEANLEMAKTCLNYMSRDIFDIEIEPDQIAQNIRSGSYRLYWFAATQWTELVRRCARHLCGQPAPETLIRALNCFVDNCENSNYETIENVGFVQNKDFEVFVNYPGIYSLLHEEIHFQHMDVGDWKLEGQDDSWAKHDPVSLSYMSLNIYQGFELLICPGENHKDGCDCAKLMNFYGNRLFRCPYTVCQYRQIAFETKSSRDAHCRSHDRPYKCPHPSCDFSALGFFSRSQLGNHTAKCHSNTPPKPVHLIKDPDEDELVPLLSDMIAMNMADDVASLFPRFKTLDEYKREMLLREAAFSGSWQVLNCIMGAWSFFRSYDLLYISLNESIKGQNIEILDQVACRIPESSGQSFTDHMAFMHNGVNSESAEVFEIWKYHLAGCHSGSAPWITTEFLIGKVKDPVKQERLATVVRERAALGYLTKHDLGRALKAVASTTCSISLARALIENGADVEFRSDKKAKQKRTPLTSAAAKNGPGAAEMMKYLLLMGADANTSYRVRYKGEDNIIKLASMGSGAKQVSKWLGMTWDELVEWATEQRSKNLEGEVVSRLYS